MSTLEETTKHPRCCFKEYEGSIVQTCRNINVEVVNTDYVESRDLHECSWIC